MKFEEVLPYYRDGEEIEYYNTHEDKWMMLPGIGSCNGALQISFLMYGDFRIVKKKIKYYPALVRDNVLEGDYLSYLGKNKYKNESEALKDIERGERYYFVRLITEIPELIEERDE